MPVFVIHVVLHMCTLVYVTLHVCVFDRERQNLSQWPATPCAVLAISHTVTIIKDR